MTLALDIGNSNLTVGLYAQNTWQHIWRLPTKVDSEATFFYQMRLSQCLMEYSIAAGDIHQVVISTVVPDLKATFVELSQHLFHRAPILVAPEIYSKLRLNIEQPKELGTDLFANAVAAHYLYERDCIVVDFGTALTFTSIDRHGELLGVAIAPGLKTSISALFQKTAQLPEVPLELPDSAIGKNTVHAIQAGVLMGYVGLVRHLLHELKNELGQQYIAVATGGLSSILRPLQEEFHAIEPHLTLDGLRIIGEEVKK
ncbi:MAG TPA: type III pantothenate kinase [Phaeodactylibacter sp.]|nr:type III pantothenate kinase [Phaeodactylibacter sp.]